ncbi:uncharacterized protein LOC144872977 [Branchiostoma floridae x Branchiostoma japonicum]
MYDRQNLPDCRSYHMKMNPPVLLLAAFALKVLLVLSPSSGQAQTIDPVDRFQPLRRTRFPTVTPTVVTGSLTSLFTLSKCAGACLNSTSCLAFLWLRGILFSNTCTMYTIIETPVNASNSDLYFKTLPTTVRPAIIPVPATTQPTMIPATTQSTPPTTTKASRVFASNVGPAVLASVAIATTVAGFVLGVITSQLVQWYRSKAKGNRNLRRADLEEENPDDGHLLPLPLPRTDQAGDDHVQYDVPTEGVSVRRLSSGPYQELRPAQYQGLVHESDGDPATRPLASGGEDEGEYIDPQVSLAREDSDPAGNYEAVDDSYLELQP